MGYEDSTCYSLAPCRRGLYDFGASLCRTWATYANDTRTKHVADIREAGP